MLICLFFEVWKFLPITKSFFWSQSFVDHNDKILSVFDQKFYRKNTIQIPTDHKIKPNKAKLSFLSTLGNGEQLWLTFLGSQRGLLAPPSSTISRKKFGITSAILHPTPSLMTIFEIHILFNFTHYITSKFFAFAPRSRSRASKFKNFLKKLKLRSTVHQP